LIREESDMTPRTPAADLTVPQLAAYIDHSVLKPEFTPEEIQREVGRGVQLGCRTVCINPAAIPLAQPLCAGTSTGVCVVIDFPFGLSSTASRVAQARDVVAAGVAEVDIVAPYGFLRGARYDDVERDLRAVIEVCHGAETPVKVILETDALTEAQVRGGVEAAIAAGADFVKTSTGFYTGDLQHAEPGASLAMVSLLRAVAAGRAKIKGSGAIRTREHFLALIDAGADRLGVGYRSTPVVLGLTQPGAPAPAAGY
jgi:deoxyribose-phosphate aldolase